MLLDALCFNSILTITLIPCLHNLGDPLPYFWPTGNDALIYIVSLSYPERKIFAIWCPVVCSVSELVPCALFLLGFNEKSNLKCQKPPNKSSLIRLSHFPLLKGIKT